MPHCSQATVVGALTFQAAFRRRVRERDIFFLGTAMRGTPWYSGIEQVFEGCERGVGVVSVPVARVSIQVVSTHWAKSSTVPAAEGGQRYPQGELVGYRGAQVDLTTDDGIAILIRDLREVLGALHLDGLDPLGQTPNTSQIGDGPGGEACLDTVDGAHHHPAGLHRAGHGGITETETHHP